MRLQKPLAIAVMLTAHAAAHSQTFQNLGFEAATVPASAPAYLGWESAVPGWTHSTGADTQGVYYGQPHVGTTQWYLLLDSTLQQNSLINGRFALSFTSGYAQSNAANPVWVNAFVAQTATVPANALSVHFMATGPLDVYLAGTKVPMLAQSANHWAVDVSSFAGRSVELRFQNYSNAMRDAVSIDNIEFLPTAAVPEPATGLLLLGGLALLAAAPGRRARRPVTSATADSPPPCHRSV